MTPGQIRLSRGDLRPIYLESEALRVLLLPDIGFKIASIVYKKNQFEALARPIGWTPDADPNKLYARAYPGAAFHQYDVSGIDDCIPTIQECTVREFGNFYDHGDAWSRPWNVFEEDRTHLSVKAYFRLSIIPLYFERHVHLEGNTLLLDYRLLNESIVERPWMWALHALCRYEPDALLTMPEPFSPLRTDNYQPVSFDVRHASEAPKDAVTRFCLAEPVPEGMATIDYPSQKMAMDLEWDSDLFPYIVGTIQPLQGKEPRTLSIQPTNGYYDSLDRAIENHRVGHIAPGKDICWRVKMTLRESGETASSRFEKKQINEGAFQHE